ncbi:uracil-DNA glycosylase [Maritalea mediterranea]|uniref:Type-5 uracil-DNA glycosylase n=1 Tax=Maritalea mediterranea TaxID=2909667 RepID=A0ABS9E5U8_9HYPH|nr:uracil-DNA glycosylase [Maritalea mediterranea]MCF4098158.1 uracil-DNA glycosylase [Maritalea mediterranea]
MVATDPAPNCSKCPRLKSFRKQAQKKYPDFFNAPVPNWAAARPRVMVVGMAPGMKGANRTGRPFTGDFAGDLLFQTLIRQGFAAGTYGHDAQDGLSLIDCAIVNVVRCVPPQNKPTAQEVNNCRRYLQATLKHFSEVEVFVTLGGIAHNAFLSCFDVRKRDYPFGHGIKHELPTGQRLLASYHCSRYNVNTNVLTPEMFDEIFRRARQLLSD